MFIDTHAHITDNQFKTDRALVIEKAIDCSVEKIITSGCDILSSQEVIKLANQCENIYASIGIYPEYAEKINDIDIKTLEKLAKNEKVVAIGEIGLQYTEGMPAKEKQKEIFVKQLKLAFNQQKPIVIHCRDAYGDMIAILKENKDLIKFGGTFHCFSGSYEIAQEILKLGFYISVGGVSTFKNAVNLQETLKKLPLERLLLETDCPYLAPSPYRGKRNEPAYIPTIAENLSKLKGISVEEVGEKTTENARRLFRI